MIVKPNASFTGTFRGSDSSPKERFLYHYAGMDGMEGSSYIDSVFRREIDLSNGWTGAADGTLEVRQFYCQNWRADVVAIINASGGQVEQVRYGEYGVPFGMPAGDTDGDGDVNNGDTVDSDQIQTWIDGSRYDVRGDLDLDGDVDASDKTAAIANAGIVLGWGKLSIAGKLGGNRKGYAGYEFEPVTVNGLYDTRSRFYVSSLGRTTTRGQSPENMYLQVGLPFGPMSEAECIQARNWCLANDPTIQWLISQIEECFGQPMPNDRIICNQCLPRVPERGSYVPDHYVLPWGLQPNSPHQPFGVIFICFDTEGLWGGIRNCETIRHELVHMLQMCKERASRPWHEWNDPLTWNIDRCLQWEVEARCIEGSPLGQSCCTDAGGNLRNIFSCCSQACGSCASTFAITEEACYAYCKERYATPVQPIVPSPPVFPLNSATPCR